MPLILLVGVGGFLGAVTRYQAGLWAQDMFRNQWLPYGTITVNLIGCLVIGLIAGLTESRQMFNLEARTFIVIGLLGGFTAFSAFGHETMQLARDGDAVAAATNVGVQVGVGLAAVWGGYGLSRLA